jgi:hypothetical protein
VQRQQEKKLCKRRDEEVRRKEESRTVTTVVTMMMTVRQLKALRIKVNIVQAVCSSDYPDYGIMRASLWFISFIYFQNVVRVIIWIHGLNACRCRPSAGPTDATGFCLLPRVLEGSHPFQTILRDHLPILVLAVPVC